MANSLTYQITEEGPRNAVVKLTGVLDTSNVSELPAIALGDFHNNDQNLNLTTFRVDLVEYVIASPLEVILEWQSATPLVIFALAGRGRIGSLQYGGVHPDKTLPGFTGNINLRTTGYVPGTTAIFTILLELTKMY